MRRIAHLALCTALAVAVAGRALAQDASHEQASALSRGAPWQAEIYSGYAYTEEELQGRPQWDKAHRCGGSYVKDHWVLTAAHCFYKKNSEDLGPWRDNKWRIRLGARDLTSGEGVTFVIDEVVIHPDFVHSTYANDVALVHFVADSDSRALAGRRQSAKRVTKIRINGSDEDDRPVALGDALAISGWGKTENRDDAPTSGLLEWAKIHAVDCAWGVYKDRTTDSSLCAYGKGKDACQGDSGGPLIRAGGAPVLVGIVSWGVDCGKNAGVYVRLDRDHYLDWINGVIGAAEPD